LSDATAASSDKGDRAPLVTIAMPIYNAGHYLRPAVMSILQQTLADFELLIIDDGSTDGATEDIRDIGDPRVRILRDGLNKGLAARLNEAIDLARGKYVARMDQDDISYPERLSCQLAMLERNRELDLVGVRCVAIDANNEFVGALPHALTHEELSARPWTGFYLPHPTWMGRVGWFRRHRYASPGPFFCEDQELLLRSYRESRFATVPEVLFAYRVRNNINWGKSFKTRKTLLGIQLGYFFCMRQFHCALLATMAFVGRVALDSLNALVQTFGYSGVPRHSAGVVEADEKLKWRAISHQLALTGTQIE
jgi:glycosyltransferase involved in cell wall biosynthesis